MYGDFIRKIREAAGLSQVDLACIIGTSQPTISAYEHGRRAPSLDVLNKLVSGCGFVLTALGEHQQVVAPFPQAGWFPEEEPWPPGPDFAIAGGHSPHHAEPSEKAVQLDAVLDLADAIRNSKA